MNCLAFDVGGTYVKYGLVNQDLSILENHKFNTPKNESDFINEFSKIIVQNEHKFETVSIAMPGFINKLEKKFLFGTNIQFSIDFKKLMNFNSYNLYLDNDGNVSAFSEYFQYYRDQFSNLIMLTFGTGIGGGIIANKKLLQGSGSAGEIGHILTSIDNSILCNCGKNGCFEASTAATVWTNKCQELSDLEPNSELAQRFKIENVGSILFDDSIKFTSLQLDEINIIIQNISNGLVSLFEIFDNEIFVLGGAMSSSPYSLIKLIDKDINSRFKFPSRIFPKIEISLQKGDSGIIGAAALAFNETK